MRSLEIFQLVGEVRVRAVEMLLHRLHPHPRLLLLLHHLLGVVLGRVVVVALLLFRGVVPQGFDLERQTAISESGVVRQVGRRGPNP